MKRAALVELGIRFDAAALERHLDVGLLRKQVHVLVRPIDVVARSQQALELQDRKALAAQLLRRTPRARWSSANQSNSIRFCLIELDSLRELLELAHALCRCVHPKRRCRQCAACSRRSVASSARALTTSRVPAPSSIAWQALPSTSIAWACLRPEAHSSARLVAQRRPSDRTLSDWAQS